ncbi:hypothetical protein EVA_19786, partial [gut metagenome]
AAIKAKGLKVSDLHGCIGADPIGELVKTGATADLEKLYDEMAEAIRWSKKNAPKLRTIFCRQPGLY